MTGNSHAASPPVCPLSNPMVEQAGECIACFSIRISEVVCNLDAVVDRILAAVMG